MFPFTFTFTFNVNIFSDIDVRSKLRISTHQAGSRERKGDIFSEEPKKIRLLLKLLEK